MFVVDSNVFVYALNRSASEHSACRLLLETWRLQMVPWYTTWGILYEVLRVASHPRVFRILYR
jgi:predicted nucleic acid-binding protein